MVIFSKYMATLKYWYISLIMWNKNAKYIYIYIYNCVQNSLSSHLYFSQSTFQTFRLTQNIINADKKMCLVCLLACAHACGVGVIMCVKINVLQNRRQSEHILSEILDV